VNHAALPPISIQTERAFPSLTAVVFCAILQRMLPENTTDLLLRYRQGERDFSHAELPGASLSAKIFEDCNFTNANLSQSHLDRAEFNRCNFEGTYLTGAGLDNATFKSCSMSRSWLDLAIAIDASFIETDLSRSRLWHATFVRTTFLKCNMDCTDLRTARLETCTFDNVKFRKTVLSGTVFGNIQLDPFTEENSVYFSGGCDIDWRSICMSIRAPRLRDFLLAAGIPASFTSYLLDGARSLDPTEMFAMFRSTFISFGGPDEPFARKLSEALQRAGVRTFFYPEHAKFGEKLYVVMREGVQNYDRVILICSKSSLSRPGVQNELDQVLRKEAESGGESRLIPIAIDDHIYEAGSTPTTEEIRSRVVADFRGADSDPQKFARALERLVEALRRSPQMLAH
jgi:uncharacterized protein YjbI with pentapeptide repeats